MLSKKRASIRKFEIENPFWQYDEISVSNIDKVFFSERSYQSSTQISSDEQAKISAIFRDLNASILQGGALMSGDKVLGYCISEFVGDRKCRILVLRVISSHKTGVLPMLLREHSRLIMSHSSLITEFDLGEGNICFENDERNIYFSAV